MSAAKPLTLGLVMIGVLVLAGCEQPKIHSYTAPKDPPVPEATQSHGPNDGHDHGEPSENADMPTVSWTVPDGWQVASSDQPSRLATYKTGDDQSAIEISVSEFTGNIGDLHANLNRWRRQVGLPELDAETLNARLRDPQSGLAATLAFTEEQRIQGVYIDIGPDGGGGERILVAWLEDSFGRTWFVKAQAEAETLTPYRQTIARFANSFKLTGGEPQFSPPPAKEITWEAPEHWRATETSSLLTAAFEIENEGGQLRTTITGLQGEAGGILANLNRWRRQIGLQPVATLEEQASKMVEIDGQPATLFDIKPPAGSDAANPGILIAMQSRAGVSWFFKMTGAAKAIDLERSSFNAFIRTIKFEDEQR